MAGASKQQKIPKHKPEKSKHNKPKAKASKANQPPRLRQTRLTFGESDPKEGDLASSRPPRGGGRMEDRPSSSSSLLELVVTSPTTFSREQYDNYSPVPFEELGSYSPPNRINK
jgi:hypothetical protein